MGTSRAYFCSRLLATSGLLVRSVIRVPQHETLDTTAAFMPHWSLYCTSIPSHNYTLYHAVSVHTFKTLDIYIVCGVIYYGTSSTVCEVLLSL